MGITNEKYVSDVPLRERPLNRIGLRIRDKAINNPKIADGAITAEKIVDGAVSERTLANGAVTVDKLADGAITTDKLAPGVIDNIDNILTDIENRGNEAIRLLSEGLLSFDVDDDMLLCMEQRDTINLVFGIEEGYLYVE